MAEPDVERLIFEQGTPVKWKSRLGYEHTGAVIGFDAVSQNYTIATGQGGTAIVDVDEVVADAPVGVAPEPELSPEQLAAAVRGRARQYVSASTVDTMMTAFATLRDGLPDSEDTDGLRLEAAALVVEHAEAVQRQIKEQVEGKRGT